MSQGMPAWLEALYREKFFVNCSNHENAKKNEKNVLCLDCCLSICPHCLPLHRLHRLIQIRRYVYHEVIRLEDLDKLIDCSNVQAYTINGAKVIFINKRPQNKQLKEAANYCTSCDRNLQQPYIHCSLRCKVDYVLRNNRDVSAYLRRCEVLQLGPDFAYPQQQMGMGWVPDHYHHHHNHYDDGDVDMTNVDMADEAMMSCCAESYCTSASDDHVLSNKTNGSLYVCGSSSLHKHSHKHVHHQGDMASSISRRKGIPHRSPLC